MQLTTQRFSCRTYKQDQQNKHTHTHTRTKKPNIKTQTNHYCLYLSLQEMYTFRAKILRLQVCVFVRIQWGFKAFISPDSDYAFSCRNVLSLILNNVGG